MIEKEQVAARLRRTITLAEKALPALRQVGITGITAEELANEMGISRATFFRYFVSKEEALLFAIMGQAAMFTLDLPPQDADLSGRSLWPVLRRAVGAFDIMAREDDFRDRVRLALASPAFGSHLRLSRAPQSRRLVDELAARGVSLDTAQIMVMAATAVTDRCVGDWARADDGDLTQALDRAFAILARGY